MKRLSIVIPVFNEGRTVALLLDRVLAADTAGVEKEIIVVDDASNDNTPSVLAAVKRQHQRLKVLTHKRNRGKGAAIRTGLAAATGDGVLFQDGDLEYDPADYVRLLAPVMRGEARVVYGSRFAAPAPEGRSGYRLFFWGNRFLTWCANRLYGSALTDVHTCYKLLPTELLRELNLTGDGFEFDPEVTAKLLRRGVPIREVGISYNARSRGEGKKVRFRDGLVALWMLLRYRALAAPAGIVRDFSDRVRPSDILAALIAGLGIAALIRVVLHSAGIQLPLPVADGWFLLLLPLGAMGGIGVTAWFKPRQPVLFEIAKFGLVGALNTAIDLGLLNVLMGVTGIFRGSLFPLLKASSFLTAVTNSYFWNRYWTFGSRGAGATRPAVGQFLLFAMVALGGLSLNVTVTTVLVNFLALPGGWEPAQWANLAAGVALVFAATWDFLAYKFIVFRPATRREEPGGEG